MSSHPERATRGQLHLLEDGQVGDEDEEQKHSNEEAAQPARVGGGVQTPGPREPLRQLPSLSLPGDQVRTGWLSGLGLGTASTTHCRL